TGAYFLRFDFALPRAYRHQLLMTMPVAVAIHYAAFYALKLTRGWWRYVGVTDFINAVKAAFVGALGLGAYVLVFERGSFFPRSVLFINMVLVVGLSMGMRLAVRIWRQMPLDRGNGERKRLLIIGAGDTGEALLREIRTNGRLNYRVVAFVDDNASKRGAYINGVPILGGTAATPARLPPL